MLEKISGIYKLDFNFLVSTDHSLLYYQCNDFIRIELTLLTSPRGRQDQPKVITLIMNMIFVNHLQK